MRMKKNFLSLGSLAAVGAMVLFLGAGCIPAGNQTINSQAKESKPSVMMQKESQEADGVKEGTTEDVAKDKAMTDDSVKPDGAMMKKKT